MLIKLPWKDRKVISEVAKLYCDMAINGEGYDDRIRQFWRTSMYVKVGYLSRVDAETILTAMETFHKVYEKDVRFKDPNRDFHRMGEVIPKLRMILDAAPKKQEDASVNT